MRRMQETNSRILATVGVCVLASQLFAGEEPLDLRLNWQAGDVFRYKVEVNTDVRAGSERAHMGFGLDMELRVKELRANGSPGADAKTRSAGADEPSQLALGGRQFDVELRTGSFKMVMDSGQRVEIRASQDGVEGYLDGRALPPAQLEELRRQMRPVQELLDARIGLVLTDRGRVVKVSGLEHLSAEDQQELAMKLIENLLLPGKPLRIGERWVDTKKAGSLLPKEAVRNSKALAEKTVEIVRTLQAVRTEKGRKVAEFVAPLKTRFDDLTLDQDGTLGSVELDVVYTSLIDVASGSVVEETAKGKVHIRPKGRRDVPSLITCDLSASVTLLETPASATIARNTNGN